MHIAAPAWAHVRCWKNSNWGYFPMHDDDNDSKHKLKFLIIKVSSHSSFFLFYHKFLLKASSWLVFYGPWFTHYLYLYYYYYYYYYILFSLQSGLKTKKFMLASTFIKNCSLVLSRNKRDIRSSNSIYNLRYFPRFFGPMCPYYYSTLFVRLQSG